MSSLCRKKPSVESRHWLLKQTRSIDQYQLKMAAMGESLFSQMHMMGRCFTMCKDATICLEFRTKNMKRNFSRAVYWEWDDTPEVNEPSSSLFLSSSGDCTRRGVWKIRACWWPGQRRGSTLRRVSHFEPPFRAPRRRRWRAAGHQWGRKDWNPVNLMNGFLVCLCRFYLNQAWQGNQYQYFWFNVLKGPTK